MCSDGDVDEINHRLEEMLDAARIAGMSGDGLRQARELVFNEARDVWRLSLGPNEVASVPPMKIELIDPKQELPKPYMRRYTKNEVDWWRQHINKLVDSEVIQVASCRHQTRSPKNATRKCWCVSSA